MTSFAFIPPIPIKIRIRFSLYCGHTHYDPEGKSSRAEVVKFEQRSKQHPVIQKWFIRDLERVPEVSLELLKQIELFMKSKLGNAIISKLII